ncbi:HNH endonuclease [Streptomyces sp. NPDC002346]
MSPVRLPAPSVRRVTGVDRLAVAGIAPATVRPVPRPHPISPPMRAPEPPHEPSHRDVLRRWEELEWWACAYCDSSFGPMVVAEADHVTPLAKGGVHEWSNLAPACQECNRAKSDRDMSEWLTVLTGQMDTEREVSVTQ